MSPAQFLAILRARWILALSVLCTVIVLTVGVSLVLPKKYTTSAAVLVDIKGSDPVSGTTSPGVMSPTYMATQIDLIKSDRVAQRVVRNLHLDQSAAMRRQWTEASKGKGNFEVWLGELIQSSLDLKPSRESNVINIGYKSVDPKFAATMANGFAQAYIDTMVDLRVEPARQYNSFFDARAAQWRDALEKAQSRLSAFQNEKGITATDERIDLENTRLAELSSQVVGLQGASADSASRRAQAGISPDKLQEVLNNGVVSGLRADLGRQEAKLNELSARLGPNHPQVVELSANIAELRSKVTTETQQVSSSVGVSDNINRSREATVRSALEKQRAKVMQLKQIRDEQAVLVRDVENAQRSYDSVLARQSQSELESLTQQTNLILINAAAEPTRPSSPNVQLNALIAVFAGAMLSIGAAIAVEMANRRVLTPEDVATSLDVPVLAVLERPRRQRRGKTGSNASLSLLQRKLLGRLPSNESQAA